MKKLFLLFIIFILLIFIIPAIFSRSFFSTTAKEQENIVNITKIEEIIEAYNYKEHNVIKLLHKSDNSVEELRIR